MSVTLAARRVSLRVRGCRTCGWQRTRVDATRLTVSDTHFDVLVLGAGPGGYVAAIRAAQLGKSVGIVEEKYWGGVCLNVGCIPSKALLRNAEIAHIITHEKKTFGIEGEATMAFGPTHERSRKVADASAKGVHYLMKKNKITEIDGWGTLTGETRAASTASASTRTARPRRTPPTT